MELYHFPDPKAVTKGRSKEFFDSLKQRQRKYGYSVYDSKYKDIIDTLNEKGYAKVESFLDKTEIDNLKNATEKVFDSGNNLWRGQNKPQDELRDEHLFVAVEQPLLNVSETHDFAFREEFIDIAKGYLECFPALGSLNLRKTFVNDLNEAETQLFHVDPNSPKFLKMFIYLNDVNTIEDGPFCYVEGSHKVKFEGWQEKYRWKHDEIVDIYGKDKVKYLTAKKGDLLIADTNGWHRGTKCINSERTMLTLDYVVHPEFFESPKFFYPSPIKEKYPVYMFDFLKAK